MTNMIVHDMCELPAGGWSSAESCLLWACSDVSCLHTLPLPLLSMHPPMQDGSDPLGVAAQKGHTQVVERLLKERASINYQDKVRSTCYTTSMHYIAPYITCHCKTPS